MTFKNTMRPIPSVFAALALAVLPAALHAQSVLVAGWDFNNAVSPTTSPTFVASVGAQKSSAAIFVNGANGSSDLIEPSGPPTFNTGERSVTAPGSTLGLAYLSADTTDGFTEFGTENNKNVTFYGNKTTTSLNGKSIVFGFSMTGYQNPILNLVADRGEGGPASNSWAWSTDGINFTSAGAFAPTSGGYAAYTFDLSAVNAVDNAANLYLRLTFGGQTTTSATTNFLNLDNIQIGASAYVASPVSSWRTTYFPGSGAEVDLLDSDGDGLSNLLEYALGTHPLNHSTGPVRTFSSSRLALSLGKNPAATDVTVTVQGADSVSGPWTDLARSVNGAAYTALVGGVTVNETSPSVEVSDQYAIDGTHPARFLRVQVVGP